jgi:hypothetical protein
VKHTLYDNIVSRYELLCKASSLFVEHQLDFLRELCGSSLRTLRLKALVIAQFDYQTTTGASSFRIVAPSKGASNTGSASLFTAVVHLL